MNKLIIFILLNFFVSFICDLILNKLKLIKELDSYYKDKSILIAGFYAGITILFALIINMVISYILLGYFIPVSFIELFKYLIIAFLIGYIADYVIYKYNVFGESLHPYYLKYGIGLWGSLSLMFCISISYIIIYYLMNYK